MKETIGGEMELHILCGDLSDGRGRGGIFFLFNFFFLKWSLLDVNTLYDLRRIGPMD
jgi:hypothetical protein